jgi:hypothetical protein
MIRRIGFMLAIIEIDIHFGINPVNGGNPPMDISRMGTTHDIWGDKFIIEGACEFVCIEDLISKIKRGETTVTYKIKYREVYRGFPT